MPGELCSWQLTAVAAVSPPGIHLAGQSSAIGVVGAGLAQISTVPTPRADWLATNRTRVPGAVGLRCGA
jgi:hypothetical protein